VISEFDPRFNNSKRLWFEKALTPLFDPSVMDGKQGEITNYRDKMSRRDYE
jgi:hypothetical protein